jgi:hypothetical protein
MIERLKVTNSYNLYQVIDENSSTTIIHDFWAYFDGDDALIQTVNSLGYYDYDYYFVEGNEYVKYSYQYNSGSFISSTILEEEYRQRVIDPQWINFEAFDFGEDLGQSSEDDVYPLVVGGWNDYLSDFLLATYTIETGEITLVSPYEQDPSLMVSFQAVHTLTGEPTTLTAYIQSIGLITFASPNNSENPDNHDGQPISYETFKSMYAEGIQSFYGTYFSYDDQSHLAAYFDFIIQENGLVYYDYLTGDAVQVDILETGIFKQTGNTYENNVGSSFINLDEYNELKASYNFVDFEMLYDLNLTEIEAGFYEIDADDFEGLFNLETVRDALTMMQAYVYFDENFIRFEIDVYDNVNESAEFIGLYYDYINMPLQLNEFYLY